MIVYFRPYRLTPKKVLGRHGPVGARDGVHLMIKRRFTQHFADYFPHVALKDQPVELFLEKFKYQENEYARKVFHFLLEEERLRSQHPRPFLNHKLWDGEERITEEVVKYKLKDASDFTFLRPLEQGRKLRLDANGIFTRPQLEEFLRKIPQELKVLIEYIEDPMMDPDWKDLPVPLAQDFVLGSPCEFIIHKPNARFLSPTDKTVVFSSYMGSDLGRWHAYCELLEKGDLSLYHGILTPSLFEEQRHTFEKGPVTNMYNELASADWKVLCSI